MDEMDSRMQYALAAATDMAVLYDPAEPERPVKIDAIAQRVGAPAKYLATLLPLLKRAGLVASVQGRSGGYHLLRPPESISVGEVLSAVGTPDARRGARSRMSRPYRDAVEQLGGQIAAARRAVLRRVTLADLAEAVHSVSPA